MQQHLNFIRQITSSPPSSPTDFFKLGCSVSNLGLNDEELAQVEIFVSSEQWENIVQLVNSKVPSVNEENKESSPVTPQQPTPMSTSTPISPPSIIAPSIEDQTRGKREVFQPIQSFAWDQGEYNSPTVTIFVSLDDVGSVKDNVRCEFTKSSFDLKVFGLHGQNYRLYKDNLDKDIVPERSSFVVKKNKVIVKLQKVKGEYSYDHWTDLCAKKPRQQSKANDPMGGLMDMMKDMYDSGDDNMKKVIAEAMMKAQRGERVEPGGMDSMPNF